MSRASSTAAVVALDWPFWAALLPALVLALFQYPPEEGWPAEMKKRLLLLVKGVPVKILLGVAGIMIFKEFIARSGAMEQLSQFSSSAGIPPLLLILLLPYLGGMITGSCYASLGLTLPVLVPCSWFRPGHAGPGLPGRFLGLRRFRRTPSASC